MIERKGNVDQKAAEKGKERGGNNRGVAVYPSKDLMVFCSFVHKSSD